MALPDLMPVPDPQDVPAPEIDAVGALSDALGNTIEQNAKKSAAAAGPDEAKGYAQAALFATQALTALVPYKDPSAPNPRGDNPAKEGD